MSTNSIAEYLKFANFQMAAEAFLDRIGKIGVINGVSKVLTLEDVLFLGNDHASKFRFYPTLCCSNAPCVAFGIAQGMTGSKRHEFPNRSFHVFGFYFGYHFFYFRIIDRGLSVIDMRKEY